MISIFTTTSSASDALQTATARSLISEFSLAAWRSLLQAGLHISLLAFALLCSASVTATAADFDASARVRAARFLENSERGAAIMSYLHLSADYRGMEYRETRRVVSASGLICPGKFALVYRCHWNDDDFTDVAFLCDPRGRIESVQTLRTTAIFNQPFAFANCTIQVLGSALIQAFRDDMTPEDRAALQRLVNESDGKGLLEMSLRLQQVFGG